MVVGRLGVVWGRSWVGRCDDFMGGDVERDGDVEEGGGGGEDVRDGGDEDGGGGGEEGEVWDGEVLGGGGRGGGV